jgi:malate synthase
MGGMSAFIPNRRDRTVTERALAAVRADKEREAADGCDGTWVAHPDLVPLAKEIFDAALGTNRNQLHRLRDEVEVQEHELLDMEIPGGRITMEGLRGNVEVAIQYLEAWLRGVGAAAINDLMEDAATAEISRSQVWQWVQNKVPLDDGTPVTRELVERVIDEAVARLRAGRRGDRLQAAADVFRQVALAETFPDFLTLVAYETLAEENHA